MPKKMNEYYINCKCGKKIVYRNMKKHIKTIKHQEFIENQEITEFLLFINNIIKK